MRKAVKNRKHLSIPFWEMKNKNEWIEEISFNIPIEILKFLCLSILSIAFIMLQYQFGKNTNYLSLRKLYLFSFGLAFGDLNILIILGAFASLIIWWLTPTFRKYYFRWFKKYIMVDYWILRKKIIKFIWLNLLSISIIYYLFIANSRHSHWYFLNFNEMIDIYKYGWFYSFTNFKNNLPQAFLNIGIFFDSIYNLIYIISFGPWLLSLISILIIVFSWYELITLNPKIYWKNMNASKKSLPMIEKYLKRKNSIFYYTQTVSKYFQFCKDSANVLKIHFINCSFKDLIKQINRNLSLLSEHSATSKYFYKIAKKIKNDYFNKDLLIDENNVIRDEDIIFDTISSYSLEKNSFERNKPITYSIASLPTRITTMENEFSNLEYPINHIVTNEYDLSNNEIQFVNINRTIKNALNEIVDEEDNKKTKEIYNIDIEKLEKENEINNKEATNLTNMDTKELLLEASNIPSEEQIESNIFSSSLFINESKEEINKNNETILDKNLHNIEEKTNNIKNEEINNQTNNEEDEEEWISPIL